MAQLRPGISVVSRSSPTPTGLPTDIGTWFVVGTAQKGPTTKAQLIRSMSDYEHYFGARSVGSTVFVLYDALETFFREGGSRAYVVRVDGASAVAASKTLLDANEGNSLKISAKNVGTWGNDLDVAVVAGSGTNFILVVYLSDVEVDRSPELADVTEAYAWESDYVTVSAPTSATGVNPEVVAAQALTGGTDNLAGVTDNIRQAALSYFTADLGPGQVSMPGNTTGANRTALIAHAEANNRVALLDSTDTGTKATLIAEGEGLQASGNEYGALVGPWVKVPGVVASQPRTVPATALVAGLMARSDSVNGPGMPAAGINGRANYVIGVSQPAFSDQDRHDLNEAGLDLIRVHNGAVMLYGYRTLGLQAEGWGALSVQRVRMSLVARFNEIADRYVFAQLDGKGHTLSRFQGELVAACEEFRERGDLYGDDPDDAYIVDVGDGVNTDTTIANNELHAVVMVRISGFAEWVRIELVKVSNAQRLTAA